MKIVLLPYEFPQTRLGGIARISYEIAKELVKQGHEVIALLNSNQDIKGVLEATHDGIECHYINSGFDIFPESKIFTNSHRAFKFMIKNNLKPAVVMAWLPSCYAFNKYKKHPFFKDTKFVAFQYETGIMDFQAKLKDLFGFFSLRAIIEVIGSLVFAIPERRYLSVADTIITEDHETKRWLKKWDLNKVYVIPSGINLQKYSKGNREKIREKYGIKKKDTLIIHFGRCNPRKGIQFLIKSFSNLPKDFKLLVCGGGRYGYSKTLKKLTENLRITTRVIFTGQIGNNEQDYYHAADIVVIPSLSEGIPQTLMEAMASCKPVMCSKLPGIWGFIERKRDINWIMDQTNPEEIRIRLLQMKAHIKEWNKKAKANQKWIKQFTWDKIVKHIMGVINE